MAQNVFASAGSPEMFSDPGDTEEASESPAETPAAPAQATPETPAEAPTEPEAAPEVQAPDRSAPEAPASEGGEVEASQEPAPEEPPETDYRKRYEGLKRLYDEQVVKDRARAEFAEQQLREFIAKPTSPVSLTEDQLKTLAAKAQEAGLDPETASFFANLAQEQGTAQAESLRRSMLEEQARVARGQERAAQEAAATAQTQAAISSFREAHEMTEAQDAEVFKVLVDIGAVEQVLLADGRTVPAPAPDENGLRLLPAESLEIAWEASQNPALRQVLVAMPNLYETDEGIAMARRLAGEPNGKRQAPDLAKASAAVAAAQTLSGGTKPGSAPAQDDDMAQLEAMARAQKSNVFEMS